GIAKQIRNDLGQFVVIALASGQSLIQAEMDNMLRESRAQTLENVSEQGIQIHRLDDKRHPSRLHSLQVEYVGNHATEPFHFGKQISRVFLDFARAESLR